MSVPTVIPFSALRYNSQKIKNLSEVMAPPYDVIDEAYRKILYERNPYNVIRLILTREEDGALAGLNKYEMAHRYLEDWKEQEILIRDAKPQVYVYHQTYRLEDGRELTRKGFIALRRLESFENGKIRPHEYTFAGPKADRLNLIKATATNLSPIFGVYGDASRQVMGLFDAALAGPSLFKIQTDEGNTHEIWPVSDPQALQNLNESMRSKIVFIADGHHRYETALNYRDFRRSKLPADRQGTGEEAYHYVMMYFCAMEDEGLVILPTHRVVTVPLGQSWETLRSRAKAHFEVTEYSKEEYEKASHRSEELSQKGFAFLVCLPHQFAVLFIDSKNLAQIKELSHLPAPVRELDVTLLHQYLLPHIFQLHVHEDHDSEKIQYVKEALQALKLVNSGKASVAFILNPTKMNQVEAISHIGERMPHKSTFFYPKLLTGLVFHPLDK